MHFDKWLYHNNYHSGNAFAIFTVTRQLQKDKWISMHFVKLKILAHFCKHMKHAPTVVLLTNVVGWLKSLGIHNLTFMK